VLDKWKELNNLSIASNLTELLTSKYLTDLGIGKYLTDSCPSMDFTANNQGLYLSVTINLFIVTLLIKQHHT